MALSLHGDASDARLRKAYDVLHATRPTAVNLRWALDEMMRTVETVNSCSKQARTISDTC